LIYRGGKPGWYVSSGTSYNGNLWKFFLELYLYQENSEVTDSVKFKIKEFSDKRDPPMVVDAA